MSHTLRLTATVVPDGDWFVARCVEVEVASQGRTIEETLANLREALELYFEQVVISTAPSSSVAGSKLPSTSLRPMMPTLPSSWIAAPGPAQLGRLGRCCGILG
jgi:predicted RNase H-like HicB family nuclease